MCLSIPAKVEQIEGYFARVTVGGATYQANLQMLDDVKVGDYVLLHTGFAIQKLNEEEAKESLEVFEDFKKLNEQLDEEEKDKGERIV
ncbi:MAG: HypC/HybG/HupF family hydrogenase formation chaperone [Bacteroidales bacterium]|nr:HypC/HybG/HupF family hydrogenase formation chaperone [Bacteroidales bacterium]MCF8343109.1 HypC/HybG/HupF family hydrogenase formation chaperone [Bacteroidales bacterium]MCF8349636.1 HypC/HybG/HupF family hydrogenase formation chaperone [Bacteroidales bacterium]MCF8376077.1 HypC/HybG/HupF family hydrogenase formation chaperone [Bacteroidales bacterium]MCF8400390.1 HypC/HybG/HupF family hydrogenase formation chaperone [Bacteroidales bacterium]